MNTKFEIFLVQHITNVLGYVFYFSMDYFTGNSGNIKK